MKPNKMALLVLLVFILPTKTLYKEPLTSREGYTFTIKLATSPASGYDWFFGNEKELKDYVQLVKSEFVSNPSLVSGRIGKKVFTFKALKAGKIIIKFTKKKTWEEKRGRSCSDQSTYQKSGP